MNAKAPIIRSALIFVFYSLGTILFLLTLLLLAFWFGMIVYGLQIISFELALIFYSLGVYFHIGVLKSSYEPLSDKSTPAHDKRSYIKGFSWIIYADVITGVLAIVSAPVFLYGPLSGGVVLLVLALMLYRHAKNSTKTLKIKQAVKPTFVALVWAILFLVIFYLTSKILDFSHIFYGENFFYLFEGVFENPNEVGDLWTPYCESQDRPCNVPLASMLVHYISSVVIASVIVWLITDKYRGEGSNFIGYESLVAGSMSLFLCDQLGLLNTLYYYTNALIQWWGGLSMLIIPFLARIMINKLKKAKIKIQ